MNATTIRRPRALLLDDDPTVLRLLATALEARGFDVRAATSAEAGLELLLDELLDLDVLVVDLDLPGREGSAGPEAVANPGAQGLAAVHELGRDPAQRAGGPGMAVRPLRAGAPEPAASCPPAEAVRLARKFRLWRDHGPRGLRFQHLSVRLRKTAKKPRDVRRG